MRAMSSQAPLVDLAFDNDGIATLTLQRAPVNSLNLDLLREIIKSLDDVTKNRSKGMILTSVSCKCLFFVNTFKTTTKNYLWTHLIVYT